jgi:hypothetical protein
MAVSKLSTPELQKLRRWAGEAIHLYFEPLAWMRRAITGRKAAPPSDPTEIGSGRRVVDRRSDRARARYRHTAGPDPVRKEHVH